MQFKNLDKNLVGNIVIIVSLILVFICIAMIITSSVSDTRVDTVEWNGLKYFVHDDSEAKVTDDSLIVTSSFSAHNLKLIKTSDLTNYNKNIRDDWQNVGVSTFNETHDFYLNSKLNYGAIVPHEAREKLNGDPYKLKGNPEIIEVTGENSEYMMSFVSSAYK